MFCTMLQDYESREPPADAETYQTHTLHYTLPEPHADSSYSAARKDRVIPLVVFPLSLLSDLFSMCGPLSAAATATAT